MKAAAIARVSTPGQRDNTSPEGQLERIRTYAAERGVSISHEFVEVESGGLIVSRIYNPESPIYAALRMAERGEIDTVIFDVQDRLGRGDAAAVVRWIFQQAGARVLIASNQHDESTTEGLVLRYAGDMVSGIERMNIRRRLDQGKWRTVKGGKMLGLKSPPYGFRFVRTFDDMGRKQSTTLTHDEAERAVWMQVYGWAREGATMREIARRLETQGTPTPTQRGTWRVQSVRNMLRNPIYGGRWFWGRRITRTEDTPTGRKSRVIGTRADEDIAWFDVPGFVPWDDWQALQTQLDGNRDKFVKPAKYDYLLRGRIQCEACGYTCVGSPVYHRAGVTLYYDCRRSRNYPAQRCESRPINAGAADAAVWDMLSGWILSPVLVEAGHKRGTARQGSPIMALERTRSAQERAAKQLGSELRTAVQMASKTKLNARTMAEFEREQQRITDELERVEQAIAETTARIAQARAQAQQQQRADDVREMLAAKLRAGAALPFDYRRALVEAAELFCTWDAATDTLSVSCLFGSGTATLTRYATRRKAEARD